jgi:hypothetical protein
MKTMIAVLLLRGYKLLASVLVLSYWDLNKFISFTGSKDVGSKCLSMSQKFG